MRLPGTSGLETPGTAVERRLAVENSYRSGVAAVSPGSPPYRLHRLKQCLPPASDMASAARRDLTGPRQSERTPNRLSLITPTGTAESRLGTAPRRRRGSMQPPKWAAHGGPARVLAVEHLGDREDLDKGLAGRLR